jgi:hypothetical protein
VTGQLDDLLAELVSGLDGVQLTGDGEYARKGAAFADRPAEDAIDLHLGEEIVEAARRTPGTSASPRGPDWIRLAPPEWDEHAIDRLRAWFLIAWRAADGRRQQPSA